MRILKQGGHYTGEHWESHFFAPKHWETLGMAFLGNKNTGNWGFLPKNQNFPQNDPIYPI